MGKEFTKSLPVELTNDELLVRGQQQSRAVREMLRLEGEKKEAMTKFKGEIETQENEVKRLSEVIGSGIEYRMIECEKKLDFHTGMVRIIRTDTMQTIEERRMTPEEEQRSLDLM